MGALILVAYSFKFAWAADMNQGCIPSLFAITSIYIAILFYCSFGETISMSKILGIAMMTPCVILLSMFHKKPTEESLYSEEQMKVFGGLAVLMGCLAPLFWTFKTYWGRKSIINKSFITRDLAIDQQLIQTSVLSLAYLVCLTQHEFTWKEFWIGQIVGLCIISGSVSGLVALKTGPGGPINALICSQIVYQTILNSVFFGQTVSIYEIGGIAFGITATLMITLGDSMLAKICPSKNAKTNAESDE